jgi:hypothetical protein
LRGLGLSVLVLASLPAVAYVPPASYITQKIARARQGTGAVWVKSKVSGVSDGQPSDTFFFDVTVFEPKNQMLMALAVDADNKVLYAERRFLDVPDDKVTAGGPLPAPLPAFLLFGESPKDLVNALVKVGLPVKGEPESTEPFKFVLDAAATAQSAAMNAPPPPAKPVKGKDPKGKDKDVAGQPGEPEAPQGPDPAIFLDRMPKPLVEDTALRRWPGGIAWVLTRGPNDLPQVWVEKDTFLPVRILEGSHEIRCERFTFVKTHPFPSRISLIEGQSAVLIADLQKVVTEPELKERPKITREGFTEAGQEISGKLKALIETYYADVR